MTDLEGPFVRAIVVGTGTHEPGAQFPSFPQVLASAEEVGRCLVEVCGLDPRHLDVIPDPQDAGELERLIRLRSMEADSLFLLYYVGHGLLDSDGDLHLATARTKTYDVAVGESLPYKRVEAALADRARGGGRPTVVILDCCYAGSSARESGSAAQGGFAQSAVTGAFVLNSSAGHEQSFCPRGGRYTAFSGAFIELLRKGDPVLRPWLSLIDLYAELETRLRAIGAPVPRCHTQDRTGSLVLAPNLAYQQPDPPPPRPLGTAELPAGVSPYKDLSAYDRADHELFFGRDNLVTSLAAELAKRVREGGIQPVVGPSGAGKSSVLRAGVLHAIGRGRLGVAGSARWPQIVLKPGADPLQVLAQWLAAQVSAPGTDMAALRSRLRDDPDFFGEGIRRLPPALPGGEGCRAVIVVDQFEQVFAPEVEDADRLAFLTALQAAAAPRGAAGPLALVIAGIRSDFLGAYQEYGQLTGGPVKTAFLVYPMSREDLRVAIEGPAGKAGLALDQGFVEALLRDADERTLIGPSPMRGRSVLPHVSHALQVAWDERTEVRERAEDGTERTWYALTLEAYKRTGGIPRALSTTAESAFCELREEIRPAAERMLVSLVRRVRMGDAIVETGRTVRREELDTIAGRSVVTEVVQIFTARRLLIADENEVAFAHEAVIASWERLGDWIDVAREWLDIQRVVGEAAAEWAEVGAVGTRPTGQEPPSLAADVPAALPASVAEHEARTPERRAARELLLPAVRLEHILGVIGATGHHLADLEALSRRFIKESQRARTLRLRFRRLVTSVLVFLTLASIVLAAYARVQTHTAVTNAAAAQTARAQADSRAAASESMQQRSIDPAVAAQLAIAAYRISPTVEARSALLSTASLPPVTRLADHVGPAVGGTWAVAAARNARMLATGGSDGTAKLWSVSDPRHPVLLARIPVIRDGTVFSVAFSRNGGVLVTGDSGGQVDFWDVRNPRSPTLLGHVPAARNAPVYTMALSPDGATLADGDGNAAVRLWDIRDPRAPTALNGPIRGFAGPLEELAFSPSGGLLATCDGGEPTIRLFSTADPRHVVSAGPVLRGHSAAVTALAFSPDGQTLASGADDNTVRLWNVANPAAVTADGPPLTGHTNDIHAIAFSPDGTRLATGGNDDTVRIWDLQSRTTIMTLPHPQPVQGIVFLDGSSEIATGANDGLLRLWHRAGRMLAGPAGQVGSVVYKPDGKTLAEGDSNSKLWLWDVTDPARPVPDGAPTSTAVAGRSCGINRMAFSPGGRILAIPCNGGAIELWNLADPRHPFLAGPPLTGDTNDVDAVAFADGGRVLASGSNDTTVRLWDVSDPGHAHQIGDPLTQGDGAIFDVATSPDGRILAAGGGNSVTELWDVSNPDHPQPLGRPLGGHAEAVLGLAFSQHGQLLASAGEDGRVQLWNMTDPRHPVAEPAPLENAGGAITDVAFGAHGSLAITNADGTVWLWEISGPHHTLLAQLTGHAQAAFFADFSPDGRTLATSSIDSSAILWATYPQRAAAAVCATVGQMLSHQQRVGFLPDNVNQLICR